MGAKYDSLCGKIDSLTAKVDRIETNLKAELLRDLLSFPGTSSDMASAVCSMVPAGFDGPALRNAVGCYIRIYAKEKGICLFLNE